MKKRWHGAESTHAIPQYNEQPEVTIAMETTVLSPRQYVVIDVKASSLQVNALSADTDMHDIAYAVFTDTTHVAVVPRGPVGPFTVTIKGTDSYGNPVAPVLLSFMVAPEVKLEATVGPLLAVGADTPGMPARW